MSKYQNKKKNLKFDKKTKFNLYLIPIMVTFIVPAICRLYEGVTVYNQYNWCEGKSEYTDYFLHCKVVVFSIASVVMILVGTWKFLKLSSEEKKAMFKKMWPIALYLLCVVFSFIFAINREASIKGEYNQMEPLLVLMGYAVMAWYILLTVKTDNDIKILLISAMAGIIPVGILGIHEFFNIYPLKNDFIRKLITTKSQFERYGINYSWEEGYVFSTLFNSNYFGPYAALFAPIALSIVIGKTKLWQKICGGVLFAAIVMMLIGSRSKTGIIVFVLLALFTFVFLARPLIKKWFITVPAILVIFVGLFAFVKVKYPDYLRYIEEGLKRGHTEYALKGIDTTGECVEIFFKDYDLKITFECIENRGIKNLVIKNGEEELKYKSRSENSVGEFEFTLPNDQKFDFELQATGDGNIGFAFDGIVKKFIFVNLDGNYKIFNDYGKYDECFISSKLLDGYERIASNRGAIWRVCLSRLKKFIFIGAGPDGFPFGTFEDGNDYVAMDRIYATRVMWTRPHNYYFQMAIETGLLSVIACMIFFIRYIVDCFKLYFLKKPEGDYFWLGVACMVSVIGFLGNGIANDSLIVVSPCFWAILGLGMVVNKMRKDKLMLYKEKK